jgi:thiol-disulfide isomerase/thioredoxin
MALAGIGSALAIGCGHARYPAASEHSLLGQPLPSIQHRRTLDGQPFDPARLAGKPVLVKFFADYCAPCKESLPAAERVHEVHPEVAFVGVDEDESIETANAVVERFGITFPVIHDTGNVLSGRFRVGTLPMTFVCDATGVIRWVGGATQTEDDLRQAVEAAR